MNEGKRVAAIFVRPQCGIRDIKSEQVIERMAVRDMPFRQRKSAQVTAGRQFRGFARRKFERLRAGSAGKGGFHGES